MNSLFQPIFQYLFQPLSSILKINPYFIKRLQSLAGGRVIDLLLHFPNYFIERKFVTKISDITSQGDYIVKAEVISHELPLSKKIPYKIFCSDGTDVLTLNFFHYNAGYLKSMCHIGRKVIVVGRVDLFGSQINMSHPDKILPDNSPIEPLIYEPVYPLTAGITNQFLSNTIKNLLKNVPFVPNWFPNLPDLKTCLIAIHSQKSSKKERERVAMDEFLTIKIALKKLRDENKLHPGKVIKTDIDITEAVKIPFPLTNDQKHAAQEIKKDLASQYPMSRLLQGDVGSGKTIVSVIASAYAIESGMQVAVLAPTEILARQHYQTFSKLFGIEKCGLFISSLKREKTLNNKRLASGAISIAIGTHALIQEDVTFKNLGLVVIDEQHKFGVVQRENLISKGNGVNILYMSATPIPRTLMLALGGDMDISLIKEKPAGRKTVITSIISSKRINDVTQKLASHNSKVYWVCPLIEESEKLSLTDAVSRYDYLRQVFGEDVLLLHGKTKNYEKDRVLKSFNEPGFKVLVSTTVIEVGVNVPDADIIVIEHAERFGLSQLHQLRGRVGRSDIQSYCLLMYGSHLSNIAQERLQVIKSSDDGFYIAEKDLEIRGSGDLLGKQQTGLPEFKVADPMNISLIHRLDTEEMAITPELENFYFTVFEKTIAK